MPEKSLFQTQTVPAAPGSERLFDERLVPPEEASPVVCLGKTFASDAERRAYFTEELRKKLTDPAFRAAEGFPHGKDEDILALSDPPYYTACPNPWLKDFVEEWEKGKPASSRLDVRQQGRQDAGSTTPYHREPFAADVSEGKNDPIYNAHSYHTKVPHKAIMRYILHYTEPGDIVFDGFCGTGMTGVAAQMCGNRAEVESLGYRVDDEGVIYKKEESTTDHTDNTDGIDWVPFSRLGARRAVLADLSPAATFIAYNYNTPVDAAAFEKEARRILAEVEAECGWMYETLHVEPASCRQLESINFKPCNPFHADSIIYRKDNLPHIQVPGATYFVTFRTDNFRILSPEARKIVLDAILFWNNKKWIVFCAVVMPDHVHIIARIAETVSRRLEAGGRPLYRKPAPLYSLLLVGLRMKPLSPTSPQYCIALRVSAQMKSINSKARQALKSGKRKVMTEL